MIQAEIKWTRENLWEFVKYTALKRSKMITAFFIAFLLCFISISAVCFTMYFTIGSIYALAAAVLLLIMGVGYLVLLRFILKRSAAKLLESGGEDTIACFSKDCILVLDKEGTPTGKLSWDNVDKIYFNDKAGAAYIMTKENAMLLTEYSNIKSGSESELKKLLREKDGELSELSENTGKKS